MSAVLVDGRLVHYESWGRGPVVVFLHGWLGSWRAWMSTMEELSEHYRSYALDFWGFGDSDRVGSYGVGTYVELVREFADELGLPKEGLILVGHGLGAVVALQFAAKYPDRVSKLALLSLPLDPSMISRHLRRVSRRLLKGLPEVIRNEAEKVSRETIRRTVGAVAALGDLRPILSDLTVPTLLVYGEEDDAIRTPPEGLDKIRPDLRAFTLDDAGHFVMLDEASKLHRLLEDFLAENGLGNLKVKEEWRRRTH